MIRAFIRWWVLFSILFISLIAWKFSDDLRREFDQASAQQQWNLERIKESAAPIRFWFKLTAWAVGIPLTSLGIGLFLIWASSLSARSLSDKMFKIAATGENKD